jgi:cell division septum initiation protein DivIVA
MESLNLIARQGMSLKSAMGGAIAVTKSVNMILMQQDISIKEIPHLAEHQKAAKKQAKNWSDNVLHLIIETTTRVKHFARDFKITYETLTEDILPKLRNGDEDAKRQLVEDLSDLLKEMHAEKKEAANVASQITKFHDNFEPLYAKFKEDFITAQSLISKDDKELLRLTKEREDAKTKADRFEKALIALGAALPATAAAMAVFAASGVGLAIGGLIFLAELASLGPIIDKYIEAIEEVGDLSKRIDELNQELTHLHLIEDQISGLQSNTHVAVQASGYLDDGWYTLAQDMETVIGDLKKITPQQAADFIERELKISYEHWKRVYEEAKNLEPDGQIKFESYETFDQMITVMKQRAKA